MYARRRRGCPKNLQNRGRCTMRLQMRTMAQRSKSSKLCRGPQPMNTDTSEKGLESLIVAAMTGAGWVGGDAGDYDREYAVDLVQLRTFLRATQPDIADAL